MNYQMDKLLQLVINDFLVQKYYFNHPLIGKESQGIHKLTYDSSMKCDVDIQCSLGLMDD